MMHIKNSIEETVKILEDRNYTCFQIDGCWVFFNNQRMAPSMGGDSDGTYYFKIQQFPNSRNFLDCSFELKFDTELNKKTGEKKIKKSKMGNAYYGISYLGKRHPDHDEWLKWKDRGSVWRYPRLGDVCRLLAGVFLDSGVTVEDIISGDIKYDDLTEYIKVFLKGGDSVGHPYVKKEDAVADLFENSSSTKDENVDVFTGDGFTETSLDEVDFESLFK